MTRINAHLRPSQLCDQHLIAEYREILRVFKLARPLPPSASSQFRLGAGHVAFFYDKLKYAHKRFLELKSEAASRGFEARMEFDEGALEGKRGLYNDWEGSPAANELVVDRILERAAGMRSIRYKGERMSLEQYKQLLTNGSR